MIIIGAKLNSSIPAMYEAMKQGDNEHITKITKAQIDAGADYIDVNTALFDDEIEKMRVTLDLILPLKPAGISVDSTNPNAIESALKRLDGTKTLINSISLQKSRLDGMLPLIREYRPGVVALPFDDTGSPKTAKDRVENADRLIDLLVKEGTGIENIYLDIVAETLGSEFESGREALTAAAVLREKYPALHLSCGLSNVSFGLPKRKYLNIAFLTAAITMGLDTAIMDITSPDMQMALKAALLVNGQDEYCVEYITAYRELFA